MKKAAALAFILLCGIAFRAQSNAAAHALDFWSDAPHGELAAALTEQMTDTELLSQILMFGWAGAEPNELLYQWVSRGLGNIKVFGWNTENLRLLAETIGALQKAAAHRRFKIPLFVASDQEGGWIRHVKGETSITPGNMAIGASGYPADAWYSAYYICRELRALGINMNFAPTLDLFTNPHSTIIGIRSFGDDPAQAGRLGAAFAAGSRAAGIIPTAKHFPGHGSTRFDSHVRLPVIDIDTETFENRELHPFKTLIEEKIPAIMSGHLSFPQIDSSGAPASLSKYVLTELLRGQLGFEGLIITDDIMMNGDILFAGSVSRAVRLAIEAGNDIIISSALAKTDDALWTANLALMETDAAFRARVKDAACRVIAAKLDYFKSENPAPLEPDSSALDRCIPDKDGQRFFLEQACRSITVYKQTALPLTAEQAGRVLLAGALPKFFEEGKKRYRNSGEFHFSYDPGPKETAWMCSHILDVAAGYDAVVVCVANPSSATIAQTLKMSGKKVAALSIMSPLPAFALDWADEILLGYSYSPHTFNALFGALAGEYDAAGTLPFTERKK